VIEQQQWLQYNTAKKATKHEKVGNCLTHATRRTRTRLLLLNLVACGSANTISHLDHINKQQCSLQRRYRTSNIPVNHNGVNTIIIALADHKHLARAVITSDLTLSKSILILHELRPSTNLCTSASRRRVSDVTNAAFN